MVATCTICGFRAKRGSGIKLHCLPDGKPKALKCLFKLLSIYKENIPVNCHTRICSQHFESRPGKTTTSSAIEKFNNKDSKEESYSIENKTAENSQDLLTLAEECEEHKFLAIQVLLNVSSQVGYLPISIDLKHKK